MKQITARETRKATMRALGFSEADIRADEVQEARAESYVAQAFQDWSLDRRARAAEARS